ncbi:MAG: preprotein translocase subunit SecE [Legionellaceae bacterium]
MLKGAIEGRQGVVSEVKYNKAKWLLVIFLIFSGILANYHYNGQPWPLRLLAWLFLLGVLTAILLQTSQGKKAYHFAVESRMELRKVVWPTHRETLQTTLFVVAMVIVLALILWGIDGASVWLIGSLTGQRG